MARTYSYMLPLGTEAPNFILPDTVSGEDISLSKIKGIKGTLIIFMCNHCPYVLHLLDKIIEISNEIKELGINTVGISSNDVENYPEDHPKLMKKLAEDRDFSFPYLYDETQSAAISYEAACTPDFFLFDSDLKLVLEVSLMMQDQKMKNRLVEKTFIKQQKTYSVLKIVTKPEFGM